MPSQAEMADFDFKGFTLLNLSSTAARPQAVLLLTEHVSARPDLELLGGLKERGRRVKDWLLFLESKFVEGFGP